MRKALITGITGQDGSYLTELLLSKGYEVHGLVRRASTFNRGRIDHLAMGEARASGQLQLHYGDMADGSSMRRVVESTAPNEVYNLAAQSHVRVSFDQPEYTADVVATGTLRLLETVREHIERTARPVRFYQAGSSEMFGATAPPQTETTHFHPRSPYAVSKMAAHWFAVNHREAFGMYCCNGILFNHESPRRGESFVTRKISMAVGRIVAGTRKSLALGNLDARRDWGFAGDYVDAMWRMLQQDAPDDYVVATGESHTVREFVEAAFGHVNLDWQKYVTLDEKFYRPTEVDHLLGDASKARTKLGWSPEVTFDELVKLMVDSDVALAEREARLAR
ncbi:MAG: GDP-mannose 4,6-dehydratase [Gemmatimonadaceae bacterium]